VDIALALAAAMVFALGTVLLQKAGMAEPPGGSASGLLLRMARRPLWLAGIAADALGFVLQAVALTIGRLAVVQPLLVSSVVFALPLGAKLTGQRVQRIDVFAALLVTAGLVAFLTIADPSGGRDDAPVGHWLVAGGAIAIAVVPLVLVGMRMRPSAKAALLGTAAGILFAITAALTKAAADRLDQGLLEVFTDWHVYALLVIGYVSMTLNQVALGTGVLAPAIATSLAADPIVSVVLGVTLFDESLHETPLGVVATLLSLLVALGAIAILARSQEGGAATKPGSGSVAPPQAAAGDPASANVPDGRS
jgi:drug/metabolite transporter (DMT)-like permease